MKTALLAVPTVVALLVLAACEPESKPRRPSGSTNVETGFNPTPSPTPNETPTPTPSPEATATPTPSASIPSPTPGATGSIPYGIPVPGKPGFVTSPYAPGQGYVDVQGFAPNSEVKDPYSGRTFLVP